jgi:hypothetical protein
MIRAFAIVVALVLIGTGSTARAQSAEAYQLVVIKGSNQLKEVVVREQIATASSW